MSENTKLIIIRHGRTDFNHGHKLDGQFDTQLTEEGLIQARNLAEYLKDERIDKIYSSPLTRAVKTAETVQRHHSKKVEIVIEPDFKEIDCGKCTGLTKDEIAVKFPELIKEWAKNTDPPFPGGESLRDVEKRAMPVVNKILADDKGKVILISGHGSLNLAILGYYLEIPHAIRFNIKQSNCCINEIEFSDNGFSINKINFTV